MPQSRDNCLTDNPLRQGFYALIFCQDIEPSPVLIGGIKMNVGIDELFDMLSWDSDKETQLKGIELGKRVKCFSVFLRPHGPSHGKDVWENCKTGDGSMSLK